MQSTLKEWCSKRCREILSYDAPLMIGIDEHSIHKGRKFATSIVDMGNHRVYDVIEVVVLIKLNHF